MGQGPSSPVSQWGVTDAGRQYREFLSLDRKHALSAVQTHRRSTYTGVKWSSRTCGYQFDCFTAKEMLNSKNDSWKFPTFSENKEQEEE